MEIQHTPGPWVAVFNNVFWEVAPENRQENDPYTIGDVCASNPENPESGLQEANARLFAAAPELLAALEGVLRVADRATKEFDAARAAIAKALGQSVEEITP